MRFIVGASEFEQAGWVSARAHQLPLLDPAAWPAFLHGRPVDAILCECVLEHIDPEDALTALRTCYRYLEPGGYLRLAVPDGWNPDPQYIDWVRPGGVGSGAQDHRFLYTRGNLEPLLKDAGFGRLEWLEWFDADGELHMAAWDVADGLVQRSRRFDSRPWFSMLIVDAFKEQGND